MTKKDRSASSPFVSKPDVSFWPIGRHVATWRNLANAHATKEGFAATSGASTILTRQHDVQSHVHCPDDARRYVELVSCHSNLHTSGSNSNLNSFRNLPFRARSGRPRRAPGKKTRDRHGDAAPKWLTWLQPRLFSHLVPTTVRKPRFTSRTKYATGGDRAIHPPRTFIPSHRPSLIAMACHSRR